MEDIKVTKEQFLKFEEVRQSGVTNMWDLPVVCHLTGLGREVVLAIMHNYSDLKDKYMPKEDR
jgi:hypothetical protein